MTSVFARNNGSSEGQRVHGSYTEVIPIPFQSRVTVLFPTDLSLVRLSTASESMNQCPFPSSSFLPLPSIPNVA